jgi:hypothetical protein
MWHPKCFTHENQIPWINHDYLDFVGTWKMLSLALLGSLVELQIKLTKDRLTGEITFQLCMYS